jgi:hypothetical protein
MQQLNKPATKAARGAQHIVRKRDVQGAISNTAVRTKRKNPPRNKNPDHGQIKITGLHSCGLIGFLAPVASDHNNCA